MTTTNGNYINGEWIESKETESFETINPAKTSDIIGRYPQSEAETAERAIRAAKQAQANWSNTPAPERGMLLSDIAQRLGDERESFAELITREQGQPISDARTEVDLAIGLLRYYAQKARELGGEVRASGQPNSMTRTVQTPLGVVSVITPWNVPLSIPVWKIAPAIATGNTVIWKPASITASVAHRLMTVLDDAGVPDGVVNLVMGSGRELGTPLTTHPDVAAISFTGSTEVGDTIYQNAAPSQKRIQMEMGGNNPAIVMPSADQSQAVGLVAQGAFARTGEACTATSRAIVHEDIYETFLDELVAYTEELTIGPGLDDPDIGPHASESELESSLEYVEIGRDEGATLLTGGSRITGETYDDGYYIEPTVFADVDNDMQIATEEIFGPILSVIRTTDFEQALEIANDTEFGLSASIMTDSLEEGNRFIEAAEAGVVNVNQTTTGAELHMPFGGMKASSAETVREMGEAGLDFFTLEKTAYVSY